MLKTVNVKVATERIYCVYDVCYKIIQLYFLEWSSWTRGYGCFKQYSVTNGHIRVSRTSPAQICMFLYIYKWCALEAAVYIQMETAGMACRKIRKVISTVILYNTVFQNGVYSVGRVRIPTVHIASFIS